MTRTLLTAIFLTLFSQAAWAEAVFYCSSEQIIKIENDKAERYQNENFKLAVVDNSEIITFRGGPFNLKSFNIHYAADENWWDAGSEKTTFSLRDGRLYGAITHSRSMLVISAKCDKF